MTQISAFLGKIIALLLFAVSFIVPGSPDNMDISVELTSAPEQEISVIWKNNTGKAIDIPRYYIEKQAGDSWEEIPFSEDFGGFPDIAATYYPTEGRKFTVKTAQTFGKELQGGTYRITLYYNLRFSDISEGKASAVFVISD